MLDGRPCSSKRSSLMMSWRSLLASSLSRPQLAWSRRWGLLAPIFGCSERMGACFSRNCLFAACAAARATGCEPWLTGMAFTWLSRARMSRSVALPNIFFQDAAENSIRAYSEIALRSPSCRHTATRSSKGSSRAWLRIASPSITLRALPEHVFICAGCPLHVECPAGMSYSNPCF